jgi:hypothetical protein
VVLSRRQAAEVYYAPFGAAAPTALPMPEGALPGLVFLAADSNTVVAFYLTYRPRKVERSFQEVPQGAKLAVFEWAAP